MVKTFGRTRSASCQFDPPRPPGYDCQPVLAPPPPAPVAPSKALLARFCNKRNRRRQQLPLLWRMTVALVQSYTACNAKFRYDARRNPRRVLTKPSTPVGNGGHDNANADLILAVHDILQSENESPVRRFRILDLAGHGTFGQVVKCQDLSKGGGIVAIKVIKNKPAYYNQAFMEIRLLKLLNDQCDPRDEHHIVRLRDNFMYKNHLCLAFEYLNVSLYDTIKRTNHRGQPVARIRAVCRQVLQTLQLLRDYRIIHCDLKPENILLTGPDPDTAGIKVIDFGSACFDYQTVYSYIQSRFYRAPEILLQIPYHAAIDVWSLGCIAAELYIGLPLFPGVDEPDQMRRIVALCGLPSLEMLQRGAASGKFFSEVTGTLLNSIAGAGAGPASISIREALVGRQDDPDHDCFVDFLRGLLPLTPEQRWTPAQAALHPFLTGAPFAGGPYQPPAGAGRGSAAPRLAIRSTPPQYSYSGHRLGGGQVGSACGEPHPRMIQAAFQRMSLQGQYVRLQPAPLASARPRRASTTMLGPPMPPPVVGAGSAAYVPYSPMRSPPGVDDWYRAAAAAAATSTVTPFSPMASPNMSADWDPYWVDLQQQQQQLPSSAGLVAAAAATVIGPMSPGMGGPSRRRRSSVPVNPYFDQYGGSGGPGAPLNPPSMPNNRRHMWF